MSETDRSVFNKLYTPDAYPTYDNYPAIEVSRCADVPVNFMGLMGVPITFMGLRGFETAFELVGISGNGNDFTPGLPNGRLMLKGKEVYRRLLVRWKASTQDWADPTGTKVILYGPAEPAP